VNILTDLAAAYLSDLQFDKAREYAEKAMVFDPDSNVAREVLSS
jgi:Tfp pilus assembly protein PilF